MDREYHSVVETVHKTTVVILDAQACLDKEFLLVSGSSCSVGKCPATYRSPPQTIFADSFILKSPAAEILISDCLSLRSLKTVLKKFDAALESGDRTAAEAAYKLAVKAVDQAINKGIMNKNAAARKKSSMTLKLNKLA